MPDQMNPVTNQPMAPLSSVFSGEKETPHAVYQKNRVEGSGSVSNQARPNDMALACPICKDGARVFAKADREGGVYYCLKGHKWNDIEQLMALNPEKLQFKGTPARQEGFKKITFEVPGSVEEQLITKYGDKLAATLASVMEVISASRFLLMGEQDIKRIADKLGEDVKSSAHVVGKLYELQTKVAEQDETINKLRANLASKTGRAASTISATEITTDFGEDIASKILSLAQQRELPADDIIRGVMETYLQNEWA